MVKRHRNNALFSVFSGHILRNSLTALLPFILICIRDVTGTRILRVRADLKSSITCSKTVLFLKKIAFFLSLKAKIHDKFKFSGLL